MTTLSKQIAHQRPCGDAVEWMDSLPEGTTPQQAWDLCERGDWMLWLIGKQIKSAPWSDDRKLLLLCCVDCADLMKHLRPKNYQEQIGAAVEELRRWAHDETTVEDAKKARKKLHVAAYVADGDAYAAAHVATYVADAAAAYAAATAHVGAYVAHVAAYIADVVATYVAYVTNDTVRAQAQALKQCANIVRKHFPNPPEIV